MFLVIQNDPLVPLARFATLLEESGASSLCWQAYLGTASPPLESFAGIIVLGGTMGVHDEGLHPFLRQVKEVLRTALVRRIPLFGICLGGQLLAEVTGGTVASRRNGERGLLPVRLSAAALLDPLFIGLPKTFPVFQWHNDSFEPASDALLLAGSERCPFQAFRIGMAWGVQFHPEVDEPTVASWCAGEDGGEALYQEFSRFSDDYLRLSRMLVRNFLQIVASGDSRTQAVPVK
jgi:GMP synthase-like glutamine amidotransferase